MSICDMKPGDRALIGEIEGNGKLVKRLNVLGCNNGTEVFFKCTAPLGDPVIINFKGTDFALRKKDAKLIQIKEA